MYVSFSWISEISTVLQTRAVKEVMEIFNSAWRESCGNTVSNGSDTEMGKKTKSIAH